MKKQLIFIFCFISISLFAQIPSYIPTNGLVGWWPFNGNANDESGNGNHGTVNGATFTLDRNGTANKSLNLNGLNDFVEILTTNNSFDNNTFSISFWVKTNTNQIETSIISRLETRNDNISVYQNFVIFQTGVMVALNGGCVWTQGYSSPSIISSSWRHVVYVNTPTNSKLYIDNQLIQNYTSQSPQNMTFYSYPMRFGKSTHSFWKDYNGLLDDVSIYNRTLSVQEINTLYQSCTIPSATITPQSNTNFCQGNNVVLNATTGTNYTYEWYKNSSLISGVTTNSYAATTAGNYTVKVIDGSCNATSSATTLTLIDTVTWTGIVDNDWHKSCNWSPEIVPECCNSVKIPFTPISPVVFGVGKAKNVTLYSTSGATLTVNNGANLQIETCPVNKTENSCPTLPVISTTAISSITQTSAVSGGNITYAGASSITARGVCWSTTTAPTIANSKSTDGSGTGTFTSNLTSLTGGTTYYVRAYATNASGTSYGNEVSFVTIPTIGSNYQGGKIAYIFQLGDPGYITGQTHGIIAAAADQNSNLWGCDGVTIVGADNQLLGSGLQNTIDIINGCNTTGIAAESCYNATINGYNDWFLPSKDELDKLYQNKLIIGGFSTNFIDYYWSSSEWNHTAAWVQYFSNGGQAAIQKSLSNVAHVRAIRYF